MRDFFDFRLFDFWKWIFNVADACLVIGAIMLGIYILFLHKDKSGEKDGEQAAVSDDKGPGQPAAIRAAEDGKIVQGELAEEKKKPDEHE